MEEELHVEAVAVFCDAEVRVIDSLNRIGKDGRPFGNIAYFSENVVDLARLKIGLGGTRYGLKWHGWLDEVGRAGVPPDSSHCSCHRSRRQKTGLHPATS